MLKYRIVLQKELTPCRQMPLLAYFRACFFRAARFVCRRCKAIFPSSPLRGLFPGCAGQCGSQKGRRFLPRPSTHSSSSAPLEIMLYLRIFIPPSPSIHLPIPLHYHVIVDLGSRYGSPRLLASDVSDPVCSCCST